MLTAQTRGPHTAQAPLVALGRIARHTPAASGRAVSFLAAFALHRIVLRVLAFARSFFGPRGLRLVLNVATALLVVSLPIVAAQSAGAGAAATTDIAAVRDTLSTTDVAVVTRAQPPARGLAANTRSVTTAAAEDVRPVLTYEVKKGDSLSGIADQFAIPADDLAYANGLANDDISTGEKLLIPPGHGALYYVKPGDTVAAVAEKFGVDPDVIKSYNRLYFEPEHFAPDQLIFVPGADVPAVKRSNYGVAAVSTAQLGARTGRLSWPVNGVITQYFWWGHTGVDLAAPYGTTIMASDDGVVAATGWVAVGGLRVCVQHAGGLQTCYYHTSAVLVSPGQTVVRGQPIAAIGMTGVTTGPHVHWELKINGVAVDPLQY